METILTPSSPEAQFAKEMVSSGRFEDERAVINAGVRTLQKIEKKQAALTKMLQDGRKSGIVEDFDPDAFLDRMHDMYVKKS